MRLILFSLLFLNAAQAFTVRDYITIRKTGAEHGFVSGYIASIYDNIYFFGGCKRVASNISSLEYNNIRLDMDLKIDRMLSVNMVGDKILDESLSVILIPIIKETFNCESTDSIKPEKLETVEGKLYKELFLNSKNDGKKQVKAKK